MIAISNISKSDTPMWDAEHTYEVSIGKKVIATFTCVRRPDGLADTLRAAADAVEKNRKTELRDLIEHFKEHVV